MNARKTRRRSGSDSLETVCFGGGPRVSSLRIGSTPGNPLLFAVPLSPYVCPFTVKVTTCRFDAWGTGAHASSPASIVKGHSLPYSALEIVRRALGPEPPALHADP